MMKREAGVESRIGKLMAGYGLEERAAQGKSLHLDCLGILGIVHGITPVLKSEDAVEKLLHDFMVAQMACEQEQPLAARQGPESSPDCFGVA